MAEKEQSELTIDKKVIQDFLNQASENDHTDAAGQPGIDLSGAETAIKSALEMANKFLKSQGLPGWVETNTPEMARLGVVIAQRNMNPAWLEKSPELMAAVLLSGIAAENMIAYNQMKNEPKKPAENE